MKKDPVSKVPIPLKESEVYVKGVKVNITKYAEDNGICWSTAKKRIEGKTERKKREFKGISKLDPYKEIIDFKLAGWNCSATSIYCFIKDRGYTGSLSLVTKYVRSRKESLIKQAVLRVESTPGLQGQVDWKETLTLTSRNGENYTVNIFLFILSYSKYKYLELTVDRRQDTLFRCLTNCFKYLGGVPEEIWFDNMKTVVDKHDINTNKVDFNIRFKEFSKNLLFNPIACRPYRPCTKGLVENLAKVMDRLKVYNLEFDDYDDLNKIVKKLNSQLNNEEISQATRRIPYELFVEKEKEYLTKANLDQFDYESDRQVRKVSNESMINYLGNKYSVPTAYLDQLVEVEEKDNSLHIYYNGEEIRNHKLEEKRFNYHHDDLKEIVSTTFPNYSDNQIESAVERRLKGYDLFVRKGGQTNE